MCRFPMRVIRTIMTRPPIFLVALLCLWLPLQAVAGSWLPCHWLSSAVDITQDTQATHQGCGTGEPSIEQPNSFAAEAEPCFHCQMSCHFSTAVLLPESLPMPPVSLICYTSFPSLFLDSLLHDSPHRPPIHA